MDATGTGSPAFIVDAQTLWLSMASPSRAVRARRPDPSLRASMVDPGHKLRAQVLNNILENNSTGVYLNGPASGLYHRT